MSKRRNKRNSSVLTFLLIIALIVLGMGLLNQCENENSNSDIIPVEKIILDETQIEF